MSGARGPPGAVVPALARGVSVSARPPRPARAAQSRARDGLLRAAAAGPAGAAGAAAGGRCRAAAPLGAGAADGGG